MTETEQIALRYLNEHRQEFLGIYTRDIKPMDEKSVIFTAGMSGAGKTEFESFSQARENIERLLKRGYNIQIVYIYNTPEECFKYAIEREVVTHRKVPKDVFVRSNENSYRTVKEIKKHFKEKITVNFIDRRTNMYHLDIDENFLKEKLGENFED